MITKISVIEGSKYHREQFASYKYRAKVKFILHDGTSHTVELYTTEVNKVKFLRVIEEKMNKEKAKYVELIQWYSRKEDDLTAKFIDEVFKNSDEVDIPVKEESNLDYWDNREKVHQQRQMDKGYGGLYPNEVADQGRKV